MFPPSIAKGKRYAGWLAQNACVAASEPMPRNVVMSGGSFAPPPLSVTCHHAPRPSTVPDAAADPGVPADDREARDGPVGRERRAVLDVAVGEPAVRAPVRLGRRVEAEVLELERPESEDVVRDEVASAGRRWAASVGSRRAGRGEHGESRQQNDALHRSPPESTAPP